MGNCLITRGSSSSMVWAEGDDDEWEWVSKEMANTTDHLMSGKNRGGQPLSSSSSSSPNSYSDGKVKITISKKQLLQLLRKGEVSNNHNNNNTNDHSAAAVEELQLLAKLLQVDTAACGGGGDDPAMTWCQRSWRPRLQSIPELN